MTAIPTQIFRADYRPPAYLVDTVSLDVTLHPTATQVTARLKIRRNPDPAAASGPLRLDGEALTLISAALDGTTLAGNRHRIEDGKLVIDDVPAAFELETVVRLDPDANTTLSGLYRSSGDYFTQCEAEGFRRITYFPDRPDVMARYDVTLRANRTAVPVLLSNGNCTDAGSDGDTHWARFVDPHPKPSYLFAIVAGSLVSVSDHFVTKSGRRVALHIWVRPGHEDRCAHAMRALKASMKWDEDVYGLEYDLDVFHIAAVSDFNMGAMENKGLNIFNTAYVLANAETATDADFQNVETVIAHEYFHNWTGNRVTCRDWFQLSLKEGLTVFRDQEFSADQGSRTVKRISDVRGLRAAQFREDASPLAHPVRPESYAAIDNFYTATVYQKGAEVIRMTKTLIGDAAYYEGIRLYFQRHDNQAVTIDDFAQCMADSSGRDLTAFKRWYSQHGTPDVIVRDDYDPGAARYTMTLTQTHGAGPEQEDLKPWVIPVAMGLVLPDGTSIHDQVLTFDRPEQTFTFDNVPARPVPSLLRAFSAPVKLSGLTPDQLRHLAAEDPDPFVRWDSSEAYAVQALLAAVGAEQAGRAWTPDPGIIAIRAAALRDVSDPATAAILLGLPGIEYLCDQMPLADPAAAHTVLDRTANAVAAAMGPALRHAYASNVADPARIDGDAIAARSLRHACLAYLSRTDGGALARAHLAAAGNMTERMAALSALVGLGLDGADDALAAFHAAWHHDALVLDKWFGVQASAPLPGTLAKVRALQTHPDYDLRNPNRVRALIGAFAYRNPVCFHAEDGSGYAVLRDTVAELDPMNPQLAARMVVPLTQWRRQAAPRATLMRDALQALAAQPRLSQNTSELIGRALT